MITRGYGARHSSWAELVGYTFDDAATLAAARADITVDPSFTQQWP
jgi:hypothetical protein